MIVDTKQQSSIRHEQRDKNSVICTKSGLALILLLVASFGHAECMSLACISEGKKEMKGEGTSAILGREVLRRKSLMATGKTVLTLMSSYQRELSQIPLVSSDPPSVAATPRSQLATRMDI